MTNATENDTAAVRMEAASALSTALLLIEDAPDLSPAERSVRLLAAARAAVHAAGMLNDAVEIAITEPTPALDDETVDAMFTEIVAAL